MGRRGPKKEPKKMRLLKGGTGNRPEPEGEPEPKLDRPTCPQWLTEDARAEWRRLAPELDRLALLTIVDGTFFASYCQAYADMRRARRVLAKKGWTYKTPTGYLRNRPEVQVYHRAIALVASLGAHFGLSPASRTGLDVMPAPPPRDTDNEDDAKMEKYLSDQ